MLQTKPRFSFWYKLMSGAGIVVLLIFILLLLGNKLTKDAEYQQIRMHSMVVKPLGDIGDLQSRLYRLRIITANLVQSHDYFAVAAEIAELEKQMDSFSDFLELFDKQISPVYTENVKQIKQKWLLLRDDFEQIIQAASQMNVPEVARLSTYHAYPRFNALINEQKHLSTRIKQDAEMAYQKSLNDLKQQRYRLIFVSIIVIFIIPSLLYIFARYLSNRVNYLHAAFKQVAEGKVDCAVNVEGNDELTELAIAFNTMREKVTARQQALENARDVLEEKVAERTLELAEKNKDLERLAVTDRLTGLRNRRSLDNQLSNEFDRFIRTGHGFGVILLDVDHFKSVNDNYGHQVGDDVLKDIAKVLHSHTRRTDCVGRWGGEEFLIICPEIDRTGLLELTRKIRVAIELYEFPVVGSKTASFGATIAAEGDSIESIVGRADRALYQAKEYGRNRVELS